MSDDWPPPAIYLGGDDPGDDESSGSNTMRFAVVGGLVVLVLGLAAAAAALAGFDFGLGDDTDRAIALGAIEAPVPPPVFEPAGSEGESPFFPISLQLAGFEEETGEVPTEEAVTSGLFGGTAENTCDPQRLINFLLDNPDKGRAWAQVQGISFDEISDYINSLSVRVIAEPTIVLNHGYDEASGSAFEIESRLEAGTAVLVDDEGNVRTRCYCGNPTKPKPVGHKPPRCLVMPALVYALPNRAEAREGVPADVVLTGRITADGVWTEISWDTDTGGTDTARTGWTEATNLGRSLCRTGPPPAPSPSTPTPSTSPTQTPTTRPTTSPSTPTPTTRPTTTPTTGPSPAPIPTVANPTPTATVGAPTPTVPPNPQPFQISCSISDTELLVGEQTEFSAVHVPDSVSVTYAFDHGDGTIDRRNPSLAFYASPGTYDVYVIATVDGDDIRQLCGRVTVTASGPDTVQIFCSISATRIQVGGLTTFTASSDPAVLPITYVFDHGDGYREQANPSFATYAQPGSYPVTLDYTYLGRTNTVQCGTVIVDGGATPVACSDQGYDGLLLADAQSLAISRGCAWRVAGSAGDTAFRVDRVNFHMSHGRVEFVTIG